MEKLLVLIKISELVLPDTVELGVQIMFYGSWDNVSRVVDSAPKTSKVGTITLRM